MLIVCYYLSSRGSFAIGIAVSGGKTVDEVGDKAEEENLCVDVLYLLQALTRRLCEVKRLLHSLISSVIACPLRSRGCLALSPVII
jgi:hypothetical protein